VLGVTQESSAVHARVQSNVIYKQPRNLEEYIWNMLVDIDRLISLHRGHLKFNVVCGSVMYSYSLGTSAYFQGVPVSCVMSIQMSVCLSAHMSALLPLDEFL